MADNNSQNNTINRVDMTATIVQFVDREREGEFVRGKADLSENLADKINEGFIEVSVGDCRRDGVMPTQAQIIYLEERRAKRDKLTGKAQIIDLEEERAKRENNNVKTGTDHEI